MTLDEMHQELLKSGLYRIQKKYTFKKTYKTNTENLPLRTASIIDVETTGLNANSDEIFNVGLVQFSFDDAGQVYSVLSIYSGFQEPSIAIPDEVIRLTQINNKMVANKSLDLQKIENLLNASEFIVAHNAAFDRAFVRKLFPSTDNILWCDTLTQVPWDKFEVKGKKLENIAYYFNYFFDAHLALNDCLAVLELLTRQLGQQTVLTYLINSLHDEKFLIKAVGSPFTKNGLLKERGYDFNSTEKTWYKLFDKVDVDAETKFLTDEIYNGSNKSTVEQIKRVDLFQSKR